MEEGGGGIHEIPQGDYFTLLYINFGLEIELFPSNMTK